MSTAIDIGFTTEQYGTPFVIGFVMQTPFGAPIDLNFAIGAVGNSVTIQADLKLRSPVNIWRTYVGSDGDWFELPASSLRIQKNYDRTSIISVEIPAANEYIAEIDARKSNLLRVCGGIIVDGVETLRSVYIALIDSINYAYNPRNVTCTITANRNITNGIIPFAGNRWYVDEGIFNISIADGEIESFSSVPRYQINPGDIVGLNTDVLGTATVFNGIVTPGTISNVMLVGTVTYTIGPALATMIVQRLTRETSVKNAETILSGAAETQPPAGTVPYTVPAKTTAEMSGEVFSEFNGVITQGDEAYKLNF